MTTYSLTIKSSSAARKLAKDKEYKFVFAKGVSTGGDINYNTAWFVLDPDQIGNSITVNWTVNYVGNFSAQTIRERVKISDSGNNLPMSPGGQYNVSDSSTLVIDKNRPDSGKAFHFHNSMGYGGEPGKEYTPILKSDDNQGKLTPIWAATTGVTVNGVIAAEPVEVVRVWLGKYEQGEAVLAEYATVVAEFDLTNIFTGFATINDNLSKWTALSSNAKAFEPDLDLVSPLDCNSMATLDSLVVGTGVLVLAAFKYALTTAAITYLTNKLIDKFSGNLKPSKINLSHENTTLEVEFDNPATLLLLAVTGMDTYEQAVNNALKKAAEDPKSELKDEKWSFTEKKIAVYF